MNSLFLIFLFLESNKPEDIIIAIVIVIFVLLLFIGVYFYSKNLKKRVRGENFMKNGILAIAEVIDYRIPNISAGVDGKIERELQLLIKPNKIPEFMVTATVFVSKEIPPRPGDTIYIKYDPADTSNVIIINKAEFISAGGALPSETMQAKF